MADDVELIGIAKRFGATEVLRGISLAVPRGELFFLLGPSGCGKTTLLRTIAGLSARRGPSRCRRPDVTAAAGRAPLGMVFQNYALFPHLSVADNVAYGLDGARHARPEPRAIARSARVVRLDGARAPLPTQLSGGQQQRVALARALS